MDRDSGLVHTTEKTAGNVSDVSVTPKLLHGEEENLMLTGIRKIKLNENCPGRDKNPLVSTPDSL